MLKRAFVWRESIYKNGFRCNKCGHVLADKKTGELKGDALINTEPLAEEHEYEIICPKCGSYVAFTKLIQAADDDKEIFKGKYNEEDWK